MVTAAVDNHSVENSRDTLSKSHYAGTVCSVRLLCSEKDMAEGGRDSSPHSIFPPSKNQIWSLGVFCFL